MDVVTVPDASGGTSTIYDDLHSDCSTCFSTRSEEVSRDVQVAKLTLQLQKSQEKTNSVERVGAVER